MKQTARAFLALSLMTGSASALPAQSDVSREDLSRHDVSDPGHEAIQVRVTLPPRAKVSRHRHPGEEIVYVLKGTIEYRLDGQPPSRLSRGDVLFIPYGVPHSVRNLGTVPAIEIATYLVTKGKPLIEAVD